MTGSEARRALAEFLASAFGSDELRRWVSDNFEGHLWRKLPDEASAAGMAFEVVALFDRHGMLYCAFFARLTRTELGAATRSAS